MRLLLGIVGGCLLVAVGLVFLIGAWRSGKLVSELGGAGAGFVILGGSVFRGAVARRLRRGRSTQRD